MIESAPYYWVVCDSCGRSAQEESEYAAWADRDQAVDDARESGWTTALGRHHCGRCTPLHECEDCGVLVDDPLSGERDYLCPVCWGKTETGAPSGAGGMVSGGSDV